MKTENFQQLMIYCTIIPRRRYPNIPGSVIQKLPSSTRQELSSLSSDDISSSRIRDEEIRMYVESPEELEVSKLKTKFDRKMKVLP